MSLSPQQVGLIQQNFAAVEPIAEKAAEIFYAKLFEYDPKLKALFKSDLKDQGRKLMSTLKVAVKGLNDLEKLVPVLQQLARKHIDYGVGIDDYTPVGNALIYTLGAGLGDKFTPDAREAWVSLYKLVAQVMREAAYPNVDLNHYKNTKQYKH